MIAKGRLLLALPLVCGLLLLAGCKRGNPHAPARVTGKVTYKSAPVPGGTITFHAPDGTQYPTNIGPDGSYGVELPAGDLLVSVETESLNPDRKIPTYDEKTSGSAGPMAKMYGKKSGGGGSGKNKAMGSPAPEGASMSSSDRYVKIPPRYSDKQKSGLNVLLSKGDQKKDFDLTD